MASSPSLSLPKHVPTPKSALQFVPSGSNWGAYWTFVTASMLIMLLLYLAANGQLSLWLSLFSFTTPSTVATSAASTATTVAEVAGGPAAATGAAVTSGAANLAASLPGASVAAGQSFYNSFLNFLGYGPKTSASGGSK